MIKRLRSGEKVDVDAEVPPIRVGTISEVAKVADALTTLQRTAVESAIAESRLRQGINQVFLNLAWRSQSLLHRQLSMLDTMEREASDPDALEGLFALDHLTTRMRRHAEGLVILSGSAPARGWHNPVAVRDILRGAIAEVEDYTRVVVPAASPAALDGSVVADVTHLLAELIENATAFSPPATQVQVRGVLDSAGYTVEIEDRGIGMNDVRARRRQPPAREPAGVRPGRQRPARPVHRRTAGRTPQCLRTADDVAVRRDSRGRAHPARLHRERRRARLRAHVVRGASRRARPALRRRVACLRAPDAQPRRATGTAGTARAARSRPRGVADARLAPVTNLRHGAGTPAGRDPSGPPQRPATATP